MEYKGDISLEDAWIMLTNRPEAVLVDVRTQGEWDTVGVPDLAQMGKKPVFVEWNQAGGVPNDNFVDEVKAAVPDADTPVLLLCRSGARSVAASTVLAGDAGYTEVYNVLGGFEDPQGGAGWAATLPSTNPS